MPIIVTRKALTLPFVFLFLPLFAGCGPLISTQLILSAQAELDGATAAQAETHATYEMVAAQSYLDKAREEQGYADFGPAIDYAFKAEKLAKKARERAVKEREKATPPSEMPFEQSAAGSDEADVPQIIIKKTPVAAVPVTSEAGTTSR